MDVVYIYRAADDGMLRASLRNLTAHYSALDRLIIVGDCPSWCQPDLVIPYEFGRIKTINMAQQMLAAARILDSTFLEMNDDFFLLSDYKPINYYYSSVADYRTLHIQREGINYYNSAMVGLQGKYYDLHCPFRMDPVVLRRELPRWIQTNSSRGTFNTLHFTKTHLGNLQHEPEEQVVADFKLYDQRGLQPQFLTEHNLQYGLVSLDANNLDRIEPYLVNVPSRFEAKATSLRR